MADAYPEGESEAWGNVRNDAADLNRQMDEAMAEIGKLRRTVQRLPDRHQPYVPAALPEIAPTRRRRSCMRRSSNATSEAAEESDREKLLRELRSAGRGALDNMSGAVVLEVLPSKRCVHFGTVVAGAVQPTAAVMIVKSKVGAGEADITEKARRYALLLARVAEEVQGRDGPFLLRRVYKSGRGGKQNVHVHDVVAMSRHSGERIPKWIRGKVAELPAPQRVFDVESMMCDQSNDEGQDCCSICLEGNFHVSCIRLTCGHQLHQKCLKGWLKALPNEQTVFCPMCKQVISGFNE